MPDCRHDADKNWNDGNGYDAAKQAPEHPGDADKNTNVCQDRSQIVHTHPFNVSPEDSVDGRESANLT